MLNTLKLASISVAAIAAGALLLGGCAAANSEASSPLNLSSQYVGQSGATTRPDSDARVQCRCGSWSSSKGAPTVCKKILLQREHEREAAEAAAARSQQNAASPTTLPSLMPPRAS